MVTSFERVNLFIVAGMFNNKVYKENILIKVNFRNCGLDDTCVFCSKCFHATNHDGHDILFSVSPGSGGCCDCGDPEAWKVPLQCNIHSLSTQDNDTHTHLSETTSLDPALLSAIRFTIVSVVDFLLDNFAIAPEEVALNPSTEDLLRENRYQRKQLGRIGVPLDRPTLSLSQNTTIMQDIPMDQTETVEEDVDMDKDNGNANKATGFTSKEQDGELYACIAWNDEAHAFSHVLESIMTATGWDWAKAKRIVDVIHVHVCTGDISYKLCHLTLLLRDEKSLRFQQISKNFEK